MDLILFLIFVFVYAPSLVVYSLISDAQKPNRMAATIIIKVILGIILIPVLCVLALYMLEIGYILLLFYLDVLYPLVLLYIFLTVAWFYILHILNEKTLFNGIAFMTFLAVALAFWSEGLLSTYIEDYALEHYGVKADVHIRSNLFEANNWEHENHGSLITQDGRWLRWSFGEKDFVSF